MPFRFISRAVSASVAASLNQMMALSSAEVEGQHHTHGKCAVQLTVLRLAADSASTFSSKMRPQWQSEMSTSGRAAGRVDSTRGSGRVGSNILEMYFCLFLKLLLFTK